MVEMGTGNWDARARRAVAGGGRGMDPTAGCNWRARGMPLPRIPSRDGAVLRAGVVVAQDDGSGAR